MIKHISTYEWYTQYEHEVYNNDRPAVIIFGAQWCDACHKMTERLSEFVNVDIDIFTMDVDESSEIADELGVTGLPTVVTFEKGEVSNMFENNVAAEEIIEYIKEM